MFRGYQNRSHNGSLLNRQEGYDVFQLTGHHTPATLSNLLDLQVLYDAPTKAAIESRTKYQLITDSLLACITEHISIVDFAPETSRKPRLFSYVINMLKGGLARKDARFLWPQIELHFIGELNHERRSNRVGNNGYLGSNRFGWRVADIGNSDLVLHEEVLILGNGIENRVGICYGHLICNVSPLTSFHSNGGVPGAVYTNYQRNSRNHQRPWPRSRLRPLGG